MDAQPDKNTETDNGKASGPVVPEKHDEYTDGRNLWDWKSKYPDEAQTQIKFEARILVVGLAVALILAGAFLGLGDARFGIPIPLGTEPATLFVNCKLIAIFLTGCVGGITFSIKWLVHSAATGKWHLDRRYWRLLVPWIGGVYALVVLALFDAGLFARANAGAGDYSSLSPALAFLVGYFSDGVSGLLSNVANAVFGTLEKK